MLSGDSGFEKWILHQATDIPGSESPTYEFALGANGDDVALHALRRNGETWVHEIRDIEYPSAPDVERDR